jgi:hypothetical protein
MTLFSHVTFFQGRFFSLRQVNKKSQRFRQNGITRSSSPDDDFTPLVLYITSACITYEF